MHCAEGMQDYPGRTQSGCQQQLASGSGTPAAAGRSPAPLLPLPSAAVLCRCKPKKCKQECKKSCPVVKVGCWVGRWAHAAAAAQLGPAFLQGAFALPCSPQPCLPGPLLLPAPAACQCHVPPLCLVTLVPRHPSARLASCALR